MKTAADKSSEFVQKNVVLSRHCDIKYTDVIESLIKLLKEQDRDTRHACADALESCDMMDDKWIRFDAAESAIMNTKAV